MTATNFAFYGRVSTEELQDPASSKRWQKSRAESIIEPHGGQIVVDYFDIGQSRSLPWKRRPEASHLLQAFQNPSRGFGAVVIGEPARAFYGNQFGLTFPLFVHYGIELWVPEVGGRVDPGSDAHDLVMSLYGGMSKGERNRIKTRVRSAMAAQAQHEGRYLGGRPPYGYQLAIVGPHPNPSKAADGKTLKQLEVDPLSAPVVKRIFDEYLSGHGFHAIAERLTAAGIPSPSATDPERNRHRDVRAWSKFAVRAILMNPRYTGYQVWNRQRRDEVLLDPEDVGAGHDTKMRWNDPSQWIRSSEQTHEALVSPEVFTQVQSLIATHGHRPTTRKRPTQRTYQLTGLVTCAICNRRMPGSFNNGVHYYRCVFPQQYAKVKGMDHPRSVYIRESAITEPLDRWLARLFSTDNLDETCAALAAAGDPDEGAAARFKSAERMIADCDRRLGQYRSALDAGADTAVVAGWIAEVQTERLTAERDLRRLTTGKPLDEKEIRIFVESLHDVASLLRTADPKLKADVYAEMGVSIRYEPERRIVLAQAQPTCTNRGVGGGT
jgi:site-specific DNA recombinase